MAKAKTGLGRGLGALIPSLAPAAESVDIDLISANPFQPRLAVDAAELEELAESVRQHGVLQPLLVSRVDTDIGETTYQVIAGGPAAGGPSRRAHARAGGGEGDDPP